MCIKYNNVYIIPMYLCENISNYGTHRPVSCQMKGISRSSTMATGDSSSFSPLLEREFQKNLKEFFTTRSLSFCLSHSLSLSLPHLCSLTPFAIGLIIIISVSLPNFGPVQCLSRYVCVCLSVLLLCSSVLSIFLFYMSHAPVIFR